MRRVSTTKLTRKRQDGSDIYQARWRDPDNKGRKKDFRSRREMNAFAAEKEQEMAAGTYVDAKAAKVTLGAYVEDEWWRTKPELKPKTVASYRAVLKLEILPRFGTTPLARIRSTDVEGWLVQMKADGKSASRIKQSKNLLHQILGHAVIHGRLGYNPSAGIRAPVTTTKKMPRYITAAEVDRIAATVDDRHRVLVLVLGYLGLRWAEAVGLQRRNVHLLKRRLRIETTLSEVDGTFVRVAPKTNEERDVVLPTFLADELGAHIGRYTEDDPDALVFTNPDGTPIRNSNFRRRHWTPALAAAGVDKLTMHEMRHTSASIMAERGWSLQAVKEQLGHSSILVTSDVYSHLFDESRDELADRLDQLHQTH